MGSQSGKGKTTTAAPSEPWFVGALQFSWMQYAYQEVGVKEVPGLRHNPRILDYHATTTLKATTDEVPWCSSFVNWCMVQAGYTPTRSAAALSWASWGQQIDDPVPGCLVVTKRKGGGHVGFFIRRDVDYVWMLGGNQSDEVRISMFKASTRPIVAYVLPKHMNDTDRGLYDLLTRGGI